MKNSPKRELDKGSEDRSVHVLGRLQRACAHAVVRSENDFKKTLVGAGLEPQEFPNEPSVSAEPVAEAKVSAVRKKKAKKKVEEQPLDQTPMPRRSWSAMDWLRDWFKPQEYPDSANRRVAPRYPFGKMHKGWEVSVGTSQWPVVVSDISETGMGVITGKWHKAGTPLEIQMIDSDRETGFAVESRIVRVVQQPDGQWYLGCSLQGKLDSRELEQFR